jgi:hypothetical protein
VTAPTLPVVASWLVKAADVVVVAVPVKGADWMTEAVAPAVPSTKPTNANVAVRAETIPKAILRLHRLCMVRSPVQNAARMLVLWTHLETRFWSNLEAK